MTLTKEARAILVRTTLAALPIYTMQSTLLPKSIVAGLDRLCRAFFWGHSPEARGFHPIAWPKLCRPISHGGLCFLQLQLANCSLLCRVIWRMLHRPQELSSRILISKYGGWPTLLSGKKFPTQSLIWRGMVAALPLFNLGFRWKLGNGHRILF